MAISLLYMGGGFTALVQAVTAPSDTSDIRQSFQSEWVQQIDQELQTPQLNWTFLYDPRDPQHKMLSALDQAAEAMAQQNQEKANEMVKTAFTILEEGHRLGYYPQSQVEAVKEAIRRHLPDSLA
jgi:hypothetical protein